MLQAQHDYEQLSASGWRIWKGTPQAATTRPQAITPVVSIDSSLVSDGFGVSENSQLCSTVVSQLWLHDGSAQNEGSVSGDVPFVSFIIVWGLNFNWDCRILRLNPS